MRRALSVLVVGLGILLAGCAPGGTDAAPSSAPTTTSQSPTPSPSPTAEDQVVVHHDSVDVTSEGATTTYALSSNGEDLLAYVEQLTGESPQVTDIEDPSGQRRAVGSQV